MVIEKYENIYLALAFINLSHSNVKSTDVDKPRLFSERMLDINSLNALLIFSRKHLFLAHSHVNATKSTPKLLLNMKGWWVYMPLHVERLCSVYSLKKAGFYKKRVTEISLNASTVDRPVAGYTSRLLR